VGAVKKTLIPLVEFSPSMGWLLLMLWPIIYQYADFHPSTRGLQLLVAALIFVFLFLADLVCFKRAIETTRTVCEPPLRWWLLLFGVLLFVPIAVHLYLMPRIPLLSWMTDGGELSNTLILLREAAAKLLDVPLVLKYLFSWTLVIFAPVYIVTAFWGGRWRLGVVGVFVAVVYSLSTLAKFPFLMLCVACCYGGWGLSSRFKGFFAAVLCGVSLICVGGLVCALSSGVFDDYRKNAVQTELLATWGMEADDPRHALTLGDLARMETSDAYLGRSKTINIFNYVLYRVWLTPADVSHRWYQYYTYVKKEPLGIIGFFPSKASQGSAPSREVGIWAYQERFPHKYTTSISAYASFDADAFARGGLWGVIIATVLLLVVRVGAAWLVGAHPIGLASYGVLLCGLTMLPSSASLQAMLGAQGFFIALFILVLLRIGAPVLGVVFTGSIGKK